VDDLAAFVAHREGWTMEGEVATYGPAKNGWSARVRHTIEEPRKVPRWHVSVLDPGGVARHTRMGRTPTDAVTFAEGVVAGRVDRINADGAG
jgi:hypothetical protein